MNIALDNNGRRIEPFTGGKGVCQICGERLIAHCGEVYQNHWQHQRERNCDPWKEHETEWHRDWKAKFPIDWREVIIIKNEEKHIADIQTSDKFVIEFQNSSISSKTIKEREDFYENMIWVINAKQFDDNLNIKSSVTRLLRILEIKHKEGLDSLISAFEDDIDILRQEELKLEIEIDSLDEYIKECNNRNILLNDIIGDKLNKIVQSIHKTLLNGEQILIFTLSPHIRNSLHSSYSYHFSTQKSKKKTITLEIERKKDRLENISKLEEKKINNVSYKIIPYSIINVENYKKVLISDAQQSPLFPTYFTFKSEIDFLSYKFKQDKSIFLLNFDERIEELNLEIVSKEQELLQIEKDIDDSIQSIENYLEKELKSEKEKTISNIYQQKRIRFEKSERKREVELELSDLISKSNNYYSNESEMAVQNFKSEKLDIMKSKKGIYTYKWKHERKSWQFAKKTIYLDTGNGYLLGLFS